MISDIKLLEKMCPRINEITQIGPRSTGLYPYHMEVSFEKEDVSGSNFYTPFFTATFWRELDIPAC